jgi:hypothetical protein
LYETFIKKTVFLKTHYLLGFYFSARCEMARYGAKWRDMARD